VLENTEQMEISDEYPLVSERVSPSIIFLFPFIVGAISVSALAGANYAVVGLGVLCVIAFGFDLIRSGLNMSREMAIFMCFLIWAAIGIVSAYSMYVFLIMFSTLVQLFIMAFIITHFARNTKMARILLFAAMTGTAIVAVSAYTSGEYRLAEDVAGQRVGGLTLNANSFAMTLVYTTGIVLYFFRTAKSWLMKGIYAAGLLIMAKLVVASGSRAGFLSFVALCGVWYCFSYIREIREKPAKTIGMLIIMIVGMVVLFSSLSNTTLGERLKGFMGFLHGSISSGSIEQRRAMVEKGIEYIKQHPVMGIGLNQFTLISGEQKYSHSNYIEILCSTGVIGGLIYYSLYIALYLRLRRVGKMITDIKGMELVCLAKTMIVIICFLDIVNISYYVKQHWILLAIFIGWAFHVEHELTSRNTYIPTETEYAVTEDR
jgi:O-antigen ligase